MAIEAIASVSQQSGAKALETAQSANSGQSVGQQASLTTSTSADPAYVVNQSAQGTSDMGKSSFAYNLSSEVYSHIDRLGVELPTTQNSEAAKIDEAKKALLPSNEAISPVKADAKPTGNESLMALSKTFDHAVFMAMVNQVVSGVSDTSRTLIKQQ